jgi:hypothetical protein
VPFIVQWNGHIAPGAVNSNYVEQTDFMSTVAEIVDYTMPLGAAEDSFSLVPELTGGGGPVRDTGVNHSFWGAFAIRQKDEAGNDWKLIFTSGTGGVEDGPAPKVSPTELLTDFTKVQMYNLKVDPGEQTNLLAGGGTAGMRQKALQLQGLLQDRILAGRSEDIPPRTSTTADSTLLIDFGHVNQQAAGSGYNNVFGQTGADPVLANLGLQGKGLFDQGGGYMGIMIKTSWVSAGADTGVADPLFSYNGPYPSELAGISADALKDGFFVRDGNKLQLSVESLDAHATYDFMFYGAASSAAEYSLFTVTGGTTQSAFIPSLVNNASQVATVMGMTADQVGRILIDFEGRRSDGSPHLPGVDNDGTGFLNFIRIIEHLEELPGDYNNDRIVDTADFAVWKASLGMTGTHAADGNKNGVVDAADYIVWRRALVAPGVGSGAASGAGLPGVVPEAATIQLAIIGLLSAAAATARRRRPSA